MLASVNNGDAGLLIRRLAPSDAQAMNDMEKACFTMPWSLKQCGLALAQEAFFAWGLWRDAEILAYATMYQAAGELDIVNLGVLPWERRKGYAFRLLSLVLQACSKMGMQKALLEVRESNFAAISLYEKCGFRKCGLRKGYYTDTGENALIYSRILRTMDFAR